MSREPPTPTPERRSPRPGATRSPLWDVQRAAELARAARAAARRPEGALDRRRAARLHRPGDAPGGGQLRAAREMGAARASPAVLAHEIGHHVRFPHTLGLRPQLRAARAAAHPRAEAVAHEPVLRPAGQRVRGPHARRGAVRASTAASWRVQDGRTESPLFCFYLAVYEELWGLAPGDARARRRRRAAMEERYPGLPRRRAHVRADLLRAARRVTCSSSTSAAASSATSTTDRRSGVPHAAWAATCPSRTSDDFDARPAGQRPSVEDALEEARERGWLEAAGRDGRGRGDPLTAIDQITGTCPGSAAASSGRRWSSKHYQRLVDQLPDRAARSRAGRPSRSCRPRSRTGSGATARAPSTGPRSVLAQRPAGAVHAAAARAGAGRPAAVGAGVPRGRDLPRHQRLDARPGARAQRDDAGGADPGRLGASASSGRVRGVVYSSGPPLVSTWMYDEETRAPLPAALRRRRHRLPVRPAEEVRARSAPTCSAW